jgi:exopolysaccharide production protein ExoY
MIAVQKIFCILFLIVLFPLLIILWLAVKFSSRGPGLYCSYRLGYCRKPFLIWKFRTMRMSTSKNLPREIRCSAEWKENRKLRNDIRVTVIGRWLRRFSLDELPQIWNVLNGTMNWVGPRPIVPDEEYKYGRDSEELHRVKPGITGLWQVSGRNDITYRRRIALNLYYVRHRSWKLDLWIIYKTVWAVLGGRGAY